MATKRKTQAEITSEMTQLIASHLEAMPIEERKQRVKAFKNVIEKRGGTRPKAASASRRVRGSRRVPA
jgi:hypothetical protein